MRAISYVRVSSSDQIKGTSLDDQERQCVEALKAAGIESVKVFREEGASAKTAIREVLIEAVAFCTDKKNTIDVFMVYKVDRFARSTQDHFAVRKLLSDAGVDLRSATEPIGNDPSSKLFETMVAGFAEFDNSIRTIRAVNGMRARIKSGIWPFMAPVGYRNMSRKKNGLKKTEPDPIDPVAFPILQGLLKGYAKEVYTQMDMVRELEKAGFQAITGTKPTIKFVDHLLGFQLPFYAGLLRDAFEDPENPVYYPGLHEPMITVEEMKIIQLIKSGGRRSRIARDRFNPLFPLRRLVCCSVCGEPLTGSSSKGRKKSYPAYHCYSKACPMMGRTLAKDEVEKKFAALMLQVTPQDKFLGYLAEAVLSYWDEQHGAYVARTQEHEAELAKLTVSRAKIFELAESDVYTPEVVKQRLSSLEKKEAELHMTLAGSSVERFDSDTATARAKKALDKVKNDWVRLEPPIRSRFQKIIFPEGIPYIRNEGFGTVVTGRIFSLNSSFATTGSLSVRRGGFEPPKPIGETFTASLF